MEGSFRQDLLDGGLPDDLCVGEHLPEQPTLGTSGFSDPQPRPTVRLKAVRGELSRGRSGSEASSLEKRAKKEKEKMKEQGHGKEVAQQDDRGCRVQERAGG